MVSSYTPVTQVQLANPTRSILFCPVAQPLHSPVRPMCNGCRQPAEMQQGLQRSPIFLLRSGLLPPPLAPTAQHSCRGRYTAQHIVSNYSVFRTIKQPLHTTECARPLPHPPARPPPPAPPAPPAPPPLSLPTRLHACPPPAPCRGRLQSARPASVEARGDPAKPIILSPPPPPSPSRQTSANWEEDKMQIKVHAEVIICMMTFMINPTIGG